MKVCFPVQQDEGMKSVLYDHFGSAPMMAIVDTDANSVVMLKNPNEENTEGIWSPLNALANEKIDAVVVAGIGTGAITGLKQRGIKVYRAKSTTIQENITKIKAGELTDVGAEQCCSGKITVRNAGAN